MSFVAHKSLAFRDVGDVPLVIRKRSEGRLKTYPSVADARAWCVDTDDRRQHILDLIRANHEMTLGKYIPIEVLIDTLLANRTSDCDKLRQQLNELQGLLDAYMKLELTPEQQKALAGFKQQMGTASARLDGLSDSKSGLSSGASGSAGAKAGGGAGSPGGIGGPGDIDGSRGTGGPGGIGSDSEGIGGPGGIGGGSGGIGGPGGIGGSSEGIGGPGGIGVGSGGIGGPGGIGGSSEGIGGPGGIGGGPGGIGGGSGGIGGPGGIGGSSGGTGGPEGAEGIEYGPDGQPIPCGKGKPCPKKKKGSPPTTPISDADDSTAGGTSSGGTSSGGTSFESPTGSSPLGKSLGGASPGGSSPAGSSPGGASPGRASPGGALAGTISTSQPIDEKDCLNQLIQKDAEIISLKNALEAQQEDCDQQHRIAKTAIEQLETMKDIIEERDYLKKQLESSLHELNTLKNRFEDPCVAEIAALENEIERLRQADHLSPDDEAEVIRKEVDVLKKYCAKLSKIQEENNKLKNQVSRLQELSGIPANYEDEPITTTDPNELKNSLKELRRKLSKFNEIMDERDRLKLRVNQLEAELLNYGDLPQEVEIFRQRSELLDDVLDERNSLQKRLDRLRGLEKELVELKRKADRVDELERQLESLNNEVGHVRRESAAEIQSIKSQTDKDKREIDNIRTERDLLRKKTARMSNADEELERLRYKSKEADVLKIERDRLKVKCEELCKVDEECKQMSNKCRCIEEMKSERDQYKSKCEELLGLECECNALRAEVTKYRKVDDNRNELVKQLMECECQMADQEDEIQRLVCHIDRMSQGSHQQQDRVHKALSDMRAELEQKNSVISASEEHLAGVQSELKSTITGVSNETAGLRARIEELEVELEAALNKIKENQAEIANYSRRYSGESKDEAGTCECSDADGTGQPRPCMEDVFTTPREFEQGTKSYNAIESDEHVESVLKESKCATMKVAEELSKQFQEWDCKKNLAGEDVATMKDDEMLGGLLSENQALRRHSKEVQEVAKDQINDCCEQLKIANEKIALLEHSLASAGAPLLTTTGVSADHLSTATTGVSGAVSTSTAGVLAGGPPPLTASAGQMAQPPIGTSESAATTPTSVSTTGVSASEPLPSTVSAGQMAQPPIGITESAGTTPISVSAAGVSAGGPPPLTASAGQMAQPPIGTSESSATTPTPVSTAGVSASEPPPSVAAAGVSASEPPPSVSAAGVSAGGPPPSTVSAGQGADSTIKTSASTATAPTSVSTAGVSAGGPPPSTVSAGQMAQPPIGTSQSAATTPTSVVAAEVSAGEPPPSTVSAGQMAQPPIGTSQSAATTPTSVAAAGVSAGEPPPSTVSAGQTAQPPPGAAAGVSAVQPTATTGSSPAGVGQSAVGVSAKTDDCDELRKQNAELLKQLDSAKKEINDMMEIINKSGQKYESASDLTQTDLDKDRKEKKDLDDTVKKLQASITQMATGGEPLTSVGSYATDDAIEKLATQLEAKPGKDEAVDAEGIVPEDLTEEVARLQRRSQELEDELGNARRASQAGEDEIAQVRRESAAARASIKSQFDRDMKNMNNKYNDGIAKLQGSHEEILKEINKEHENEVETLRSELRKSLEIGEKRKSTSASQQTLKSKTTLTSKTTETVDIKGDKMDTAQQGICTCGIGSLEAILYKILNLGMQGLSFDELKLLHTKTCEATANKLGNRPPSRDSGRYPSEGDKQQLLRRINALENDLLKKQRIAQQKVGSLQIAVKMERQRLEQLRNTLDIEKRRNTDLLGRIKDQSKAVANMQVEKETMRKRSSFHEEQLQDLLSKCQNEKHKMKKLEDDLYRAKQKHKNDCDALECMRLKLDKSINNELMLKMQLDQRTFHHHHPTPGVVQSRQPSSGIPHSSRTASFYTELQVQDVRNKRNFVHQCSLKHQDRPGQSSALCDRCKQSTTSQIPPSSDTDS